MYREFLINRVFIETVPGVMSFSLVIYTALINVPNDTQEAQSTECLLEV